MSDPHVLEMNKTLDSATFYCIDGNTSIIPTLPPTHTCVRTHAHTQLFTAVCGEESSDFISFLVLFIPTIAAGVVGVGGRGVEGMEAF